MLPLISLDAVTATGAGIAKDLESSRVHHTGIVTVTGSPTTVVITLEGSHDGANWITLGSASGGGSSFPQPIHGDRVMRYVRANLNTLTGGSSPTVTTTIASA